MKKLFVILMIAAFTLPAHAVNFNRKQRRLLKKHLIPCIETGMSPDECVYAITSNKPIPRSNCTST